MSINTRGYGDLKSLQSDLLKLRDIFERQGASLIIDALAEETAKASCKFNLSSEEIERAILFTCNDLKEALQERM